MKNFSEYIRSLNTSINNNSIAANIFNEVIANARYKIYSFNYTDYPTNLNLIQSSNYNRFEHIHGRAQDNSIIMGIDDDVELLEPRYSFLYKSFSPHYASKNLAFDLDASLEVIIFGHSLGSIDYPYFRKFFKDICEESNSKKRKRKITIITYNEDSRVKIMMQLRNMNQRKMNYLFHKNDLQFICTEPSLRDQYKDKINSLIQHIRETKPRKAISYI